MNTDLPLPLFIRGKVRDSYDLDDRLLIIATDRISAFDVVLPDGIPNKGMMVVDVNRDTRTLASAAVKRMIR